MSVTIEIGGDSVVLPNPQMGNRRAVISDRVFNKSLGGSLHIRPKLADKIALTMTFNRISLALKDSLLTLLRDNVGGIFTITSYDAVVYECIITNVPFAVTEVDKGGSDCNEFNVTLDLMGVEV